MCKELYVRAWHLRGNFDQSFGSFVLPKNRGNVSVEHDLVFASFG